MEHRDHLLPAGPSKADQLAIERLLDQQELAGGEAGALLRSARRLCGRWLMLRRLRRGLTLADVALRIRAETRLMQLMELGLAESPLVADAAWHELSLVLEGADRDFQRVAEVLEVALGQRVDLAAGWIEALEAELSAAEQGEEEKAADTQQILQEADRLIQEASRNKLPRHNVLVLQVLRQATGQSLSLAEIKLRVEEQSGVSLNLADLPELLSRLKTARLVTRTDGDPPVYQITPSGSQAFVAALDGGEAYRKLERALGLPARLQPGI